MFTSASEPLLQILSYLQIQRSMQFYFSSKMTNTMMEPIISPWDLAGTGGVHHAMVKALHYFRFSAPLMEQKINNANGNVNRALESAYF